MSDTATTEPATTPEPIGSFDRIAALRDMLVDSLYLWHRGTPLERPACERRAIALQWAIDRLAAFPVHETTNG